MQPTDTAELRRLHEAAMQGVFWQEEVAFSEACKLALPDLLDELEALRADLKTTKATIRIMDQSIQGLESAIGKECGVPQGKAVWKWLLKRDRKMKLLGAAEELESIVATKSADPAEAIDEFEDGVQVEKRHWIADLKERASQLWKEAEK